MSKRHFLIGFVIIFFMTNFSSLVFGETSSKIKLHKAKVSVSPPNRQGLVTITGQPGAVESSSEAVGKTEVIKLGDPFKIAENGTFHTQVMAESGDKIRVQAKNNAKKKSYGTFTVPAQQEILRPDQPTTLTLTVMIVESQTGKPLASRQLELPPVHSKQAAQRLLDRYLSHIQREIDASIATEKSEKKVSP